MVTVLTGTFPSPGPAHAPGCPETTNPFSGSVLSSLQWHLINGVTPHVTPGTGPSD